VIVRQAHDLEPWHVAFLFETFQFGDETVHSPDVHVIHVEAAVPRIEMAFERLDLGAARLVVVLPLAMNSP
jgi:hypothetical protein